MVLSIHILKNNLQTDLFDLKVWPKQVLTIQIRVDQRLMTMKGYYAFMSITKSFMKDFYSTPLQKLVAHHQMQFTVIFSWLGALQSA